MRMGESTKERDYNILFLIDGEKKAVYMEPSFSKDPAAVLRKHLRGEKSETADIFSRESFAGLPAMWVWKAGWLTRKKALVCLLEWQRIFRSEGYSILGMDIATEKMEELPKLSGIEKRVLRNISVANLINGKISERIESEHGGVEKLSAFQKHYVDAADEVLQVRVKNETACRFRNLHKDLGMTQNQVLELLMSEHTGDIKPLMWDLRERLEKAEEELKKKDEEIKQLREALRKSEETKEYPKKYQVAIIQSELVRTLIDSFPKIDMSEDMMIKRYSKKQGKLVFPEGRLYAFPKEEGAIRIRVEHMQHSSGHPSCLFIFGKDECGNRLKIRWYPQKNIRFGESMWDSSYLWKNSPWILGVRRDGDAMELVGSSPDLAKIWFDPEECDFNKDEVLDKENYVQQNNEEPGWEDEEEKKGKLYEGWGAFYDEDDELYEEEILPENAVDRLIRDAEKKKGYMK